MVSIAQSARIHWQRLASPMRSRLVSPLSCLLLLLGLVALAALRTNQELLDAHGSAGPGLYNAECPFAEVAARDRQEFLASSTPAVRAVETAEVAAIVAPTLVGPRLSRHFDPRAPPRLI